MKITGQYNWGTFPPKPKIKLTTEAAYAANRLFSNRSRIRGWYEPQKAVASAIANKSPIKEYEPIILESAQCSFLYAKHVLKRPWPEAEEMILNSAFAHEYRRFLMIHFFKSKAKHIFKRGLCFPVLSPFKRTL